MHRSEVALAGGAGKAGESELSLRAFLHLHVALGAEGRVCGGARAEMQRPQGNCGTGRGMESTHAAARGDFCPRRKWPGWQAPAVSDHTHFQGAGGGGWMRLSALQTNQSREDPEDDWQTMRPPAPTSLDDVRPSCVWQGATSERSQGGRASIRPEHSPERERQTKGILKESEKHFASSEFFHHLLPHPIPKPKEISLMRKLYQSKER